MKTLTIALTENEFNSISYALNELSCRRQEQSIDRRSETCRKDAEELRALRTKLADAWNERPTKELPEEVRNARDLEQP